MVRRDALPTLKSGSSPSYCRWRPTTGNRLAREGLDEKLHHTTKMEDEVKGRFHQHVVIREGGSILELVAGEDKMSLVRRDSRGE